MYLKYKYNILLKMPFFTSACRTAGRRCLLPSVHPVRQAVGPRPTVHFAQFCLFCLPHRTTCFHCGQSKLIKLKLIYPSDFKLLMRDIVAIEKYKNYEEGLNSAIKIKLNEEHSAREYILSAVPDQTKVIQRIQAFWEKCKEIEKQINVNN
jgi:hypothetical protein